MIFKIWFYTQVLLIILKITGLLTLSWFWIVFPTVFPIFISALVLAVLLLIIFIDIIRLN
jgi:hypothetical protein